MPDYHVVSVYYKHGQSDISSFDNEAELRDFLLGELQGGAAVDFAMRQDLKTLINLAIVNTIESEWRIVVVMEGALIASHTNRGFS